MAIPWLRVESRYLQRRDGFHARSPGVDDPCDSAQMTTLPAAGTTALAAHPKRIAAALLDAVFYAVVLGAGGVLGFLVGLAGASGADSSGDGWEELGWIVLGSVLGLVVGFVVWLVLTVWLVRRPGARNGQTLGKQIVGIRAVRQDHTEVGVGLALLREIVTKWLLIWIVSGFVSAALGFVDGGSVGVLVAIAIWYVPAFIDDQRRALHDRMCFTRVVAAGAPRPSPAAVASGDELWPAAPAP
jgi:uncharacterized RDD family membrane protein YckC